jgi:hypothetical protein
MAVFRVEKNKNYTVMSNYHLRDKNLSLKSKGLLSVILSLPEGWNYTTRGLAAISKEGVDGIGAALKELENMRYLTRNRLRDSKGRITDTEYVVYEYPGGMGEPPPETAVKPQANPPSEIHGNPNTPLPDTALPDTDSPYTEKPYMATPYTDKPDTTQPDTAAPYPALPAQRSKEVLSKDLASTQESNNKKTHTKNPVSVGAGVGAHNPQQISLGDSAINQQAERLTVQRAQGADNPAYHAMTLADKQFEKFWQLYPRKAGKKAAKKAWLDIAPDETLFLTIMAALNAANHYWNHHGISQKHIPHPANWLNEERWEDEYAVEQLLAQPGNAPISNAKGGVQHRTIGSDYAIGGDNDPYRQLTQS